MNNHTKLESLLSLTINQIKDNKICPICNNKLTYKQVFRPKKYKIVSLYDNCLSYNDTIINASFNIKSILFNKIRLTKAFYKMDKIGLELINDGSQLNNIEFDSFKEFYEKINKVQIFS